MTGCEYRNRILQMRMLAFIVFPLNPIQMVGRISSITRLNRQD